MHLNKLAKNEFWEAIEYTRKMIPKMTREVNELFNAKPPKIDIIFGAPTAIRPLSKLSLKALPEISIYLYSPGESPLILHQIQKEIEVIGCYIKEGFKIDPKHFSVKLLSEEYAHYLYDWLHNFKISSILIELQQRIIEEVEKKEQLEAILKNLIIRARCEAVGAVVSNEIIKIFGYRDEFERITFWSRATWRYEFKTEKAIHRIFHLTHLLADYYAEDFWRMEKKEFQEYVRKNPFEITKKDLIEAETIIKSTSFY